MRTRTPLACLTQTWPVTRVTKIDSQSSSHSMYISPSSFLRFYLSFLLSVIPPLASLSLELASRLSLSLSLSLSSHSLPTSLSTLHLLDSQGSFQGNFLHKTLIISILSSQLYAYICVHWLTIYAIYDFVVLCVYYLLMKIGIKVFD